MKTIIRWILPILFAALYVATAQASTFTYTQTAIATGSLGAVSFTDSLLTISLSNGYQNGTSSCQGGTNNCTYEDGTATVTVSGVGTATLTDALIDAYVNRTGGVGRVGAAGISDEDLDAPGGNAIFNTTSSVFGTYYLDVPIGPITGAVAYINPDPIPTTLGDLQITSILNNTSTFSVTETPLPGSLSLLASSLGAMGLLGWRRKRKAAVPAAA
jgi:hypothetical protein